MNGEEKLITLRKLMKERGYDAYIIPHEDQHDNEYLSESDERIKFISNFSGSNGIGLVTQKEALMWTDGRYFIQIEKELYPGWKMKKMREDEDIKTNILSNLPKKSKIAFDFSLFSYSKGQEMFSVFNEYHIVDDINNLIDIIWGDKKPKSNLQKVLILPERFSGLSVIEKYKILDRQIKLKLPKIGGYRLLISKLDDIAWLLNLRGKDIPYNPVFFSYAFFYSNNQDMFVHLFTDKKKFESPEHEKYCSENKIFLFDYNSIINEIEKNELILSTIMVNFTTNFRMGIKISKTNNICINTDFIENLKYVKNPVEIQGFRNANLKDSVALIKFFAWMEDELVNKKRTDLNEYQIGLKSKQFREEQELFMGESFAPICGCGANAAIIHYEQNENLHSDMNVNKIILCDTGGQYMEGTTDITRTVHYGTPTAREKEMYTRVLLGNLSLERLTFTKGDRLFDYDYVPRKYLLEVNANYNHGTSHGVGHFLNVHEGPYGQEIIPGNILTNEPGYYEKDNFGIRIENEVLVYEKAPRKYGLENLTYLPYERNLIDLNLIDNDFKEYIDNFHKKVYEVLSPFLQNDPKTLDYLKKKTAPLY